jgi:hypothetical protein
MSDDIEPVAYHPETILEAEHVAQWLRVSTRTVDRLNLPCIMVGPHTKRYLARHISERLDERKRAS